MTVDTWLTWGFAMLVVASYALWALERLPRARAALAIAAFACLAVAVWWHGNLLAAANTRPSVAQTTP
jgi:Na+/H+ antiporter NhaD/arsenite permease-like protein